MKQKNVFFIIEDEVRLATIRDQIFGYPEDFGLLSTLSTSSPKGSKVFDFFVGPDSRFSTKGFQRDKSFSENHEVFLGGSRNWNMRKCDRQFVQDSTSYFTIGLSNVEFGLQPKFHLKQTPSNKNSKETSIFSVSTEKHLAYQY